MGRRFLLLAGLVVPLAASAAAPGTGIELFTDGRLFPAAIPAAGVTVYDLSAGDRLLKDLSRGLPGDPRAAAAEAKARIAASAAMLREAFAGYARASEYGLRKIPAIVFDGGAAVVYGAVDLAEAVAAYRRWRASFDAARDRSRP